MTLKEERRRQLLDAAVSVFGRKGYHRAQISDIIKKAGVARGTFYLYFEGKREIFDAIMTELFEKVRAEVKSLPREAVAEIPSQLFGNIRRVTDLLLKEPLLARILFSESVGLDANLDRRLREFYGLILDYIQRGLRQGIEMGFVRPVEIETTAVCLLGAMKEIFYQSFLGAIKPSADKVIREIYQLVLHAIARPELIPVLERQEASTP